MWPAILTLLPTIGLLFLFYVIMKHIMEGDRRERIAQRQWEQEHSDEMSADKRADKS
ncbi:hypothetical protein [Metallococcus carri]|uniref:hypothetical protein n=1 Tax=Metallococcus carri TaxID=1656884 RepID=UPI001A9F8483|nr:hypothetical protein [Metallococcus carri]